MLTKEELEAIKERCEKATKGPWTRSVYKVYDGELGYEVADPARTEDATFIANARQDIPKLIAEIEALCSIGDLDIVSSLRTEKDYLTEIIEEKDGEIERLRNSVETAKRIVGNLTHENAVLRGEKPIPVSAIQLNGGDD